MTRLAPLILLALLAGCATTPTVPPGVLPDTYEWSANIRWGVSCWRAELADRFGDDAVVVSVHGGTDPTTGRWAFFPDDGTVLDADTVAWTLRHLYPRERDVILVSCNRDGLPMHIGGVWYSKALTTACPLLPIPGDTNSAWDFEEGRR